MMFFIKKISLPLQCVFHSISGTPFFVYLVFFFSAMSNCPSHHPGINSMGGL